MGETDVVDEYGPLVPVLTVAEAQQTMTVLHGVTIGAPDPVEAGRLLRVLAGRVPSTE